MFTLINISRSFTKSQWFSFSTESTGPWGIRQAHRWAQGGKGTGQQSKCYRQAPEAAQALDGHREHRPGD